MENKVLDENLARIAQYDDALANSILMTDIEKSNLGLSKTKADEFNLVLNNVELHSCENAQAEAFEIANNITAKKDDIIIVYGLGLGYLPDAIAQKCPDAKIIIYEPNKQILKLVLSIAQIDALLMENVFLSSDIDSFRELINKNATYSTNLLISFLSSYKQLFYEDIINVLNEAKGVIAQTVANNNTYTQKMSLAATSTIYNLRKISTSPRIEQLKDVYKGKTAVILCAGPSLNDNIEIIKENKDKFITFALNPTLKLLKKHSFVPDFVVDIDVYDNSKQFQDIDLSNSYYITDAFTFWDAADVPSKKHFFYISEEKFFNYWLERVLNIKTNLKGYGTCSYAAFESALTLGFSKIIFVGQDLAFKDGKCYASGSQYETLQCIFNEEKQKYEIIAPDMDAFIDSFNNKYMPEGQLVPKALSFLENLNLNLRTVKDKDGNLIPTKADYEIFIKVFEDAAKDIKNVELINSSNGAAIEGFKNISLTEALKEIEPIEKLDLTEYKPDYDISKIKNEVEILLNGLSKAREKIIKFTLVSQELANKIKSGGKSNEIRKLIQEYETSFNGVVNVFNENKDVSNILSCCAYKVKDILQCNYSDIAAFGNALDEIINAFNIMIGHCDLDIDYCNSFLAYSETLVLQ